MEKPVHKFLKSFRYAFRGICYCVRYERNFRFHLICGGYLLLFSPFYRFSATEYMILIGTIGIVLAAEIFNTAIEAAVNLKASAYDPVARTAKDVAAGGVLCAALFSLPVGALLFLRPEPLKAIFSFLLQNGWAGLLFLLSLLLSVLFIFGFRRNKK